MINDYLRGRACIEFVRGILIQGELFDSRGVFEFEFFLLILFWL
jgi:hypothetical protein